MEKEKINILRRKMITTGLAAIGASGLVGTLLSSKAKGDQQCSGPQCSSCDSGCHSCAVCSTCQVPSSKAEPEL